MNKLTLEILKKTARDHPDLAKKNDADFAEEMRINHWREIKNRYEIKYHHRALKLWRILKPRDFSDDGYLNDHDPRVYDNALYLHHIAMKVIKRKIARDPELQLDSWDDPESYIDSQMRLF